MSAFLPQVDPDRNRRVEALNDARMSHRFNYTYVSPLAMIDRVPVHHEFSFKWLAAVGSRVQNTLHNYMEIEGDSHFSEYFKSKHGILSRILEVGAEAFTSALHMIVSDALKLTGRMGMNSTRAKTLEDFAGIFRKIGLPPVSAGYQNDKVFAWLRLAGPNAVMLHNVAALDDRFPVTEQIFQSVMVGDSLAAAGAEGRLFLVDYALLNGVQLGTFPHGQKYLEAPLALFAIDRTTKELKPVAIQCNQVPGPENPIFTPDDGWNWMLAKTTVEIADGNIHEACTHLGRTHLLIEPFVVCTFRQLAPNHPLYLLLVPHFQGTLAINEAAWKHLIAHKGGVDKLMGCHIDASRDFAVQGVLTYQFAESYLPKALASRGVDANQWLAEYPYRDDSILYWDAIHQWVSDYFSLYYLSPADLQADEELNEWVRELSAEDGGRVVGLGLKSGNLTLEALIDVCTMIIFTASVQHAAVNFPQYDVMSYAPTMPLAGYSPAPKSKTGATESDYLAMLPPLDMAELQMELGYMLGTVHYTTLGQYDEGHFDDPRVAGPLQRFQVRLSEIGATIDGRNNLRQPYPYSFLIPSGVPQSINI